MATTVAELASALQTLFTTTAAQLARSTGFIRRQRQLTGPAFAQALVFTWLQTPQATLQQLATATAVHTEGITPQSLDQRFTRVAAEFLRQLLEQAMRVLVTAQPSAPPVLKRFQGVYLFDSSCLSLPAVLADLWPGCGGPAQASAGQATLKVQTRYELRSGMLQFHLHSGRHADAKAFADFDLLPEGSLRLADLGYFNLSQLRQIDERKAYYVSRLQTQTTVCDAEGHTWHLAKYLRQQKGDRVDQHVRVGKEQLPCRLLAIRCPKAVADKRRQRACKEAKDHGKNSSAERLELCGWTVLITNAPEWLLSLQEAWVVYRVRWQIELLFKQWKSQGRLDEWRSAQPERILCEVYAKRLAVLVQHWVTLQGGGFDQRSRQQATVLVSGRGQQLASALPDTAELVRILKELGRLLRRCGKVTKRRQRPSTYQTLCQPDKDGLSNPAAPATAGPDDQPEPPGQSKPGQPKKVTGRQEGLPVEGQAA